MGFCFTCKWKDFEKWVFIYAQYTVRMGLLGKLQEDWITDCHAAVVTESPTRPPVVASIHSCPTVVILLLVSVSLSSGAGLSLSTSPPLCPNQTQKSRAAFPLG